MQTTFTSAKRPLVRLLENADELPEDVLFLLLIGRVFVSLAVNRLVRIFDDRIRFCKLPNWVLVFLHIDC